MVAGMYQKVSSSYRQKFQLMVISPIRLIHAYPPGVEGFGGELQLIDQLDDVGNRHTIAQNAGYELGIVPILGIELLAQSFDSNLVASLVDKLEIISLLSFRENRLDDLALGDRLGEHNSFILILQAGENLVGMTIE